MAEKKKKWMKGAVENAHGQFKAKAEAAGKSTAEFASEHAGDSGKTGKQARLAQTLMKSGKKMQAKMYHGGKK